LGFVFHRASASVAHKSKSSIGFRPWDLRSVLPTAWTTRLGSASVKPQTILEGLPLACGTAFHKIKEKIRHTEHLSVLVQIPSAWMYVQIISILLCAFHHRTFAERRDSKHFFMARQGLSFSRAPGKRWMRTEKHDMSSRERLSNFHQQLNSFTSLRNTATPTTGRATNVRINSYEHRWISEANDENMGHTTAKLNSEVIHHTIERILFRNPEDYCDFSLRT